MRVNDLFYRLEETAIRNYRIYCAKKNARHYYHLFKLHNIKKRSLTKEQKRQVDKIWGGIGMYDYSTHILVYSVTGKFDPYVCPELLFRTYIEMKLNNQPFKDAWADKGYFNLHFCKDLFPKTIACNINGTFYDEDYNVISEEDVIGRINKYDRYVIKPTVDSGMGKGVTLVSRDMDTAAIFNEYKKNYILQEVFEQHDILRSFNPSSVNIIRMVSLFINGEVIPLMAAVRCGGEGSFNDNSITPDGLGMFVIGIDDKGTLKDAAVHSCGKIIRKCPNGTEFCGVQIPGFEKMKEIVKDYHSKLGYFGFIGWDFAVNKSGDPIIMEYNIKCPGILYYQYVNGPLFGKRTDEIVDYLKKNKGQQ